MKIHSLIYIVLTGFLILKLEIASLETIVHWAIFLTLAFALLKGTSNSFLKGQKAVLFDFGGVVAEGDYFTEKMRIRKGIPELVNSLKKKNFKVALLTNQNAEVHEFLRKRYGLDKLFKEQIVSGYVGTKKPGQRIYAHALQKLRVNPKNTFFVDDQIENVLGAKKAGMNAIHFQSVAQTAKSIS